MCRLGVGRPWGAGWAAGGLALGVSKGRQVLVVFWAVS